MKSFYEDNELDIYVYHLDKIEEYPPMFHEHMEILYVVSGDVTVIIDGVENKLKSGFMSSVFPYTIHEYKEAENADAYLILFDSMLAPIYTKYLLNYKPKYPFIKTDEKMLEYIKRLMELTDKSDLLHIKMLNSYLCTIIGEMMLKFELEKVESKDLNTTQKLLMYCSNNYNTDINIATVSKALYLSPNHVSKIFATRLNSSFRSYINKLRIRNAEYLHRNTDLKITEIMYECGFKNQGSFNRIFCQINGMTPREYRKSIL